jgi:hypothetical protein
MATCAVESARELARDVEELEKVRLGVNAGRMTMPRISVTSRSVIDCVRPSR